VGIRKTGEIRVIRGQIYIFHILRIERINIFNALGEEIESSGTDGEGVEFSCKIYTPSEILMNIWSFWIILC